ncbi:MAG: hypothetical protein ABSG94_03085 [Brevinematales bacterium]|jgi:hypothetical protein
MDNHIKLTGILNIVYSSLFFLGGLVLCVLSALFNSIIAFVENMGYVAPGVIPPAVTVFFPIILAVLACFILIYAAIGIAGGIGVLEKKPWGRIFTLVVSFINLLHIPVGTALGVYSIWVLFDEETVNIFKKGSHEKQN